MLEARTNPLRIPDATRFEMDEQLINIMSKAMAMDVEDRFQTVDEFIQAINGDVEVERVMPKKKRQPLSDGANDDSRNVTVKEGNGFKDVAGMTALKEQLQSDVIELIQNPDQAKELGLSMPNGILFYGPPGCGKTFFAEKFASACGQTIHQACTPFPKAHFEPIFPFSRAF